MSAPTTPTSTHIYPSTSSLPTRPFSPSPPRNNSYSSSRPPSLFLGASLPITSTSQPDFRAFDLPVSGIHESYDGMPKSQGLSEEMIRLDGIRVRSDSGVGSIGEVDRTSVTGELDIPRDSLSILRSRSSDSISSASSASPPLGSTSIFAALSVTPSPSSSRRQSRLSTGRSTPPHSALPLATRSPQSAKSPRVSLSHPSSIPNSRSMPRLHQPTVVRSTSGRGIAFLPPPSQPVATDSTASLGRSRTRMSMPGRSGPMYTPGLDERGKESNHYSFGEVLRPRPATHLSDFEPPVPFESSASPLLNISDGEYIASAGSLKPGNMNEVNMSDQTEAEPTEGLVDTGVPSRSESSRSDAVTMTRTETGGHRLVGETAEETDLTGQPESSELESGTLRKVQVGGMDRDLDRLVEAGNPEIAKGSACTGGEAGATIYGSRSRFSDTIMDNTIQNQPPEKAITGLWESRLTPEPGLISFAQDTDIRSCQDGVRAGEALNKGKQKQATPASFDEPILNEITDRNHEMDVMSLEEPLASSVGNNRDNSDLVIYIPPYKPRRPSSHHKYHINRPATQSQDDNFAITLIAAISRQSRADPLTFTSPHLELYLSWAEPKSWTWVPARKYIPAKMELRLVNSGNEVVLGDPDIRARQQEAERRRGMGRNLVKAVVGKLPVVWRLAGWL